MNYPRGSEWRRWDLHVHTPFSVLSNEFRLDFSDYARELFERAAANNIAAIGVTDYFSIKGYRELKRLREDETWLQSLSDEARRHTARLLLLPNVELRGFVITDNEQRDSRVNYHVLFSDELSPDEIEANFLSRLEFTAIGAPGRQDEKWTLTDANIAELGTRLKQQHPNFTQSPMEVGMMNAIIDHGDVSAVLAGQQSRFEDKYVLVAPIDEDLSQLRWDGQGHLVRKVFIQKSGMVFSANAATREFSLGRRHVNLAAYLEEFATQKPCIHGSDAHSLKRLFEPDGRMYNWIKADPTWRGLRMLLSEPDARTFIGPRPPQLDAARLRLANTIDAVTIARVPGSAGSEIWFDNTVPLNAGMCAIIGNRGNGKSALAEVVALLGDTQRSASFSFLSANRFRHPRIGKAGQFQASAVWGDGTQTAARRLDQIPLTTAVERVRYIGQGFLEDLCNEIDRGEDGRFNTELQSVIFSHVPQADRQARGSLGALLTYLGQGISEEIVRLQDDIGSLNAQILTVGDHLRPNYRAALVAKQVEIARQLAAHDAVRPATVLEPEAAEQSPEQVALRERARELRETLEQRSNAIVERQREDAELAARNGAATRLLDRVRVLSGAYQSFVEQSSEDARAARVELASIVAVEINDSPLREVTVEIGASRDAIRLDLDPEGTGLARQRANEADELRSVEEQLNLPQRDYHAYLDAVEVWESARQALLGSEDESETVEGIAAQIRNLGQLPQQLDVLMARRRERVSQIVQAKTRLRRQYEELHRPVSEFLSSEPLVSHATSDFRFEAAVGETGFLGQFLSMIDQRRLGAFAGADEGRATIEGLLAEVDWTVEDQATGFPEVVTNLLLGTDRRYEHIGEQLRQGTSPIDLLNYLFGLNYLVPTYRLTWSGRSLSELSPGERGTLLLVFYLLVDRSDVPLVIDQPEENLDNETVYGTLVPCMRDARLRRQVVVVTHNPNLAIACDADQIIYAEIHKNARNRVDYESGSIEDPAMSKRILDVLEGTRPAFDHRAVKYAIGGG